MFSINGVALDNPALGWLCLAGSSVVSTIDVERSELVVPGQDGVTSVRGRTSPPIVPLVVETPRANQGALRALLKSPRLVLTESDQNGIEAIAELLSVSPTTYGDADEIVELRALLRIPGVYWRDTTATTTAPKPIDGATVTVQALAGLTAPVRDAIVRVSGGASGVKVTDSSGSWFRYAAALDEGEFLRFHADTGRAFVTTTDTWEGGADVTGDIENGPGPYYFEMVPTFDTDPTELVATLTVTTTARAGSPAIEIRGRRAHDV